MHAEIDMERQAIADHFLTNTTVQTIAWRGVTITVQDRKSGRETHIVDNAEGVLEAGEMCALMGPSGAGKSSLLNFLARRPMKCSRAKGEVLVNGTTLPHQHFRGLCSFVQQHDALIGSLTCFESLDFNMRLSTRRSCSKTERIDCINAVLRSFGLANQSDSLVGTLFRGGLSGGQKRRLSVASQLVTGPKILFLDEPTSGLDSAASLEVIRYLRHLGKRNNLILICSIHQPSTAVFNLFDKLMLLSAGKTQYFGPVSSVCGYFDAIGRSIPLRANPAEYLIELVNTDFAQDAAAAIQTLNEIQQGWTVSDEARGVSASISAIERPANCCVGERDEATPRFKPNICRRITVLLHRGFIKSYRDFTVYGIRLVLYVVLALLTSTSWLHPGRGQESISSLLHAILTITTFGALMASAYVPAFLEDIKQFLQDKQNGICGASELCISNFILGLPFLLLVVSVFTAICYRLLDLNRSPEAAASFVAWLFIGLLAAESIIVFLVTLVPDTNVVTAMSLLLNSLWVVTGSMLVPPHMIKGFYKYSLYYLNFQSYSYGGLLVSQLDNEVYDCGPGCHCIYQSSLAGVCKIAGSEVVDQLGYRMGSVGMNMAITMAICLGFRFASWVILAIRR